MAIKTGIELSDSSLKSLNDTFKKLALLSDKPVKEILRKEGRLFAVELANQTSNKGKSKEAGDKHMENVEARIRGIYSVPHIWVKIVSKQAGFKAGERFQKLIRARNIAGANQMLQEMGLDTYRGKRVSVIMWDNGKAHRAAFNGGGSKKFLVVADFTKIKKYIKLQRRRVGNLKSGWARAAEMLGVAKGNPTRGIPGWAKSKSRNHDNKGTGTVTGMKHNSVLTLSNDYQGHVSAKVFQGIAIKNIIIRMKIRIKKDIERDIRKLNRRKR